MLLCTLHPYTIYRYSANFPHNVYLAFPFPAYQEIQLRVSNENGLASKPGSRLNDRSTLYSVHSLGWDHRGWDQSRVGAVALYTVLWTVVAKYRKWPFSALHRTKTPYPINRAVKCRHFYNYFRGYGCLVPHPLWCSSLK
jgi:hypothetical protein